MTHKYSIALVTLTCLVLVTTPHAFAQVAAELPAVPAQSKAPQPRITTSFDKAAAARLEKMTSTLGQYTVVNPEDPNAKPAKMIERPLQRWADHNAIDGLLVAYASSPTARPAILGHYQEQKGGSTYGEFSAATPDPFELKRNGRLIWSPPERYSKFQDLNTSEPPSDDAATRLKQMQQLIRRFAAVDAHGWKEADIEDHHLYFVKKPMYRYGPDKDIVDGAIFIAQNTTDPEAAIFLEAYRDDDKLKWRHRPVELTIYKLTVRFDDKIVWEKPRELIFGNQTSRHYSGPIR